MRVLVVTAVGAEADSVTAGLSPGVPVTAHRIPGGHTLRRCPDAGTGRGAETGTTVDVLAAGAGPAAAAAATATALTAAVTAPGTHGAPAAPGYDLVVSAGIGGGFAGVAPLGSIVVADAIVAADLGAETPDGHLAVEELGFGRSVHRPAVLSERIAEALDAVHAPVLTVSTVTGTAARAAELTARHPRAAAEAMEGFGVAEAAVRHGVPVAEIRAVSNAVGPRDRASWRIGEALEALRNAFRLLSPVLEEEAR
ncbi:futalosine hydrolase [Streptomyces sp. ICN441]|uniref:futalosine hydrolase n=1 Tax=Streptomyces sp. ICN441 TaxID=2558286 RepID=UPI00106CDC57|nr:futalosine hydrolase [Streptomyces sp. ICN441]TFE48042.1 futalosine hydrolase [Streptomyces sp. ICN441]